MSKIQSTFVVQMAELNQCPDTGPNSIFEKYHKYKSRYGENELFWGLGIEEETYLQFSKPIQVAAPIVRSGHKRERYCVNYYKSYRPHTLAELSTLFTDLSGFYPLPFLFNAHSFTKMDTSGSHCTTYEKNPRVNPAFSGKTFFQELQLFRPELFVNEYNKSYVFDGDTIEFITQDFYKAKASAVIKELLDNKSRLLRVVNDFCKVKGVYEQYGGKFIFPPVNPGFAVTYSNPSNIAIFNNGTYHINITLPTLLGPKDSNGLPTLANPDLFRQQHKNCIRMFQWIEPLLIAMYGSPDPFPAGSKGSQRCAMSRYIGIGTYDTNKMPEGKVLTSPIYNIRGSSESFWWYSQYHKTSAYNPLTQIGMDINYRKHFLHGIELRMFDWFTEEQLMKVIEILVYVAEVSLTMKDVLEPAMSKMWNDLVVRILQEGSECVLKAHEIVYYEYLLDIKLLKQDGKISVIYEKIFKALKDKHYSGNLAKCFLIPTLFGNVFKGLYYYTPASPSVTIQV